ncbi:25621_t:CDS:1, partial [Racocetra persica]
SKAKFNEADLYFADNIETNIFKKIPTFNKQLCSKKSINLMNFEAKTNLTDLKENLYSLAKEQNFANWKDIK